MHSHTATHCNTLQHTATHSDTLQHTAAHCNTLQHTATHCKLDALQLQSVHAFSHCNTMQHTATHCNTLQHTATLQIWCVQAFRPITHIDEIIHILLVFFTYAPYTDFNGILHYATCTRTHTSHEYILYTHTHTCTIHIRMLMQSHIWPTHIYVSFF